MSQPLERLLLVAFRYPPYAAVGGKRWAKLSKYLARQGVQVHVITVPWGPDVLDAMRDVTHPNVHIHRIPALAPNRIRVTSPGPHTLTERARNRFCRTKLYRNHIAGKHWTHDAFLWGPAIIPAVARLARRTNAQAIIVTGGPFWAGYWVARGERLLPDIPLIQEFRDPWGDLPEESMPSQGGRKRVEDAERRLLASAGAIVTVTDGLSEMVRQKVRATPVHTVTNGYDPEDLPEPGPPRARPFRLIHGGNLYVGRQEPVRAFLDAVNQVRAEMPELELVFRGKVPADLRAEYEHLERSGVLRVLQPIPGPDFMRELDDSFAALHFNAKHFPYALSTKIFEYGAAGRLVLSVNYGGEIDALISAHGLGWSVRADDPHSVAQALREVRAAWEQDAALTTDPVGLEQYSYPAIARRYREVLSETVTNHQR